MLNLTIRHLQMIYALSDADNLQLAARMLSISPSALTHRIAEAQRIVGAELFTRQGGKIVLTEAGNILLDGAQRCLAEFDRMDNALKSRNLETRQAVNFGASSLTSLHWLPGFLRYLEQQSAGIEFGIGLDTAEDPVNALNRKLIDIALMPTEIKSKRLHSTFLFSDELVAVVSPDHHMAESAYLDASDFKDETYIGVRPGLERGREFERFFAPASVTPARIMPGRSTSTIIALVRAGIGVTIMSRWDAEHYLSLYDLIAVKLTRQGLPVPWYALFADSEPDASPARRAAAHLSGFFG